MPVHLLTLEVREAIGASAPGTCCISADESVQLKDHLPAHLASQFAAKSTLSSGNVSVRSHEHAAVTSADVMAVLAGLRIKNWQIVTSSSYVDAEAKQMVKSFHFEQQIGATLDESANANGITEAEVDEDVGLEEDWDLPSGWMEVPDEEGNIYYYSTTTGESTWDRPRGPFGGEVS